MKKIFFSKQTGSEMIICSYRHEMCDNRFQCAISHGLQARTNGECVQ